MPRKQPLSLHDEPAGEFSGSDMLICLGIAILLPFLAFGGLSLIAAAGRVILWGTLGRW